MSSSRVELSARVGAAIALSIGLAWAYRSALELGRPNYVAPVELADWLAVVSFSVGLGLLGAAARLLADLAGRSRPIVALSWIVIIAAVVAATANFIEDGLAVKAFGEVFALGLFGLLAGFAGLAAMLAWRRQWRLAAVAAATLVGLFTSVEAGGGFLILAAWLGVAVALWRQQGRRAPSGPQL